MSHSYCALGVPCCQEGRSRGGRTGRAAKDTGSAGCCSTQGNVQQTGTNLFETHVLLALCLLAVTGLFLFLGFTRGRINLSDTYIFRAKRGGISNMALDTEFGEVVAAKNIFIEYCAVHRERFPVNEIGLERFIKRVFTGNFLTGSATWDRLFADSRNYSHMRLSNRDIYRIFVESGVKRWSSPTISKVEHKFLFPSRNSGYGYIRPFFDYEVVYATDKSFGGSCGRTPSCIRGCFRSDGLIASGSGQVVCIYSSLLQFFQCIFRGLGISGRNGKLAHAKNYLPIGIRVGGSHFSELCIVNCYRDYSDYGQYEAGASSPEGGISKQSPSLSFEITQTFYGFLYGLCVSAMWFGGIGCVVGGWKTLPVEWHLGIVGIVIGTILIYGCLRLIYHAATLLIGGM